MPIYEFWCSDCAARVSIFYRSISHADQAQRQCPRCDGTRLQRLVSRVHAPKSEARRLAELAAPALMDGLAQEDPTALASFMRRMSEETDDPLDEEMTEAVERWEAGEPLAASADAPSEVDGEPASASSAKRADAATSSRNAPH